MVTTKITARYAPLKGWVPGAEVNGFWTVVGLLFYATLFALIYLGERCLWDGC